MILKTRFTEQTGIYIEHFKGINFYSEGPKKYSRKVSYWRHVDNDTGGHVGPAYNTKAEILADHERYLRDSWDLR